MQPSALVIEDDSATSFIMQQVLVSLGLNVKCAKDGASALEQLRSKTFDIIFLDLRLPHISGYELLEKRAELEHLRKTPVVIVTAHSRMRDDIVLGPNDQFLLKPVPLRDLYHVVGTALPHYTLLGN